MVNPVRRFVDAVNRGDLDGVEAAFHPDFEMIVPRHPARGFKGRDQEVKNMRYLMTAFPDGLIEVLRMVETPAEVWLETTFRSHQLEMAAVVIFEIDRESDTISRGRYYSEAVDRRGPAMDEWIQGLGSGRLTPGSTPLAVMERLAGIWSPTSMGKPETTEKQLDLFADSITVIEPVSLPHGGRHRGLDAYRSLQESMVRLWEQSIESARYWQCADDLVALRIVIRWTARSTGKTVLLPMVDMLRFRDGKIVEVEVFLQDTKALLDTLDG
jgi:ketosteroid isomerase-like protein